ncbi:NPCBM/NEW2 domain-containing protein [Deinococcus pimensis]|uniref:NPCBM/NEW2 domain-containing protein n=1 Tax=Deinococcus pimensis TaxID=309888 RepID=UPI0004B33B6D|nr:NPCBM/NEW2 domain-containing protein [Deinococcus pimensis]
MSRFTHRALLPLTLPLLLLACGQGPTASPDNLGPYANGATYPWSYTQAPGTVTPLVLDPGANNLYYEPILSATNGWGPIEVNRSNGEQQGGDGKPLTVAGKTYDVGYGVHADSELRWSLKSTLAGVTCNKLDGYVGVDDEVGDRGSVTFQIWLDGAKVWDSGVMTGRDGTKFYSVDTTGKSDLRLVVTNGGDNVYYDHADWIQPTVHCQQGTVTQPPVGPSGTLDPSFDGDGQLLLDGLAKFQDLHVFPDGRILTLIQDRERGNRLRRLLPNGQTDTTYGQGGDVVLTNLVPRQLLVGLDGTLLIQGVEPTGVPFVARFSPSGVLDTTYGSGGLVKLPTMVTERSLNGSPTVITPDGAAVVTTLEFFLDSNGLIQRTEASLVRLTPQGTPDPTFGEGGRVVVSVNGVVEDGPFLLPDGRIAVGASERNGQPYAIVRYTSDGQLDATFGAGGRVNTCAASVCFVLQDVDPKGRLLTTSRIYAVVTPQPPRVRRYLPDGRVDTTFGTNGDADVVVPNAPAGSFNGNLILVRADQLGRVLVSPGADLVARLLSDGRLDERFGQGGVFRANLADASLQRLYVQPDGKLLMSFSRFSRPEQGWLLRVLP